MTDDGPRVSSGWLSFPLFISYSIWTLTYGVVHLSSWAATGMILAALPLLGVVTGRAEGLAWLAPPVGILLGFLLGLLGLTPLLGNDSAGLGVLAGVLIGFPLAVVAAVLRWGRHAPILLIVTLGGLVDVMTTHAALARLASEGVPADPVALAIGSGQVTYDQLNGFSSLFTGSYSVSVPLQSLADLVLAGLVLLALVGAFLAFFSTDGPDGTPRGVVPGELIVPALLGVLGAAGFELIAAQQPRVALLVLGGIVLAVVVAIVVLARAPWAPRRPTPIASPVEGPEPPAPTPS